MDQYIDKLHDRITSMENETTSLNTTLSDRNTLSIPPCKPRFDSQ